MADSLTMIETIGFYLIRRRSDVLVAIPARWNRTDGTRRGRHVYFTDRSYRGYSTPSINPHQLWAFGLEGSGGFGLVSLFCFQGSRKGNR